MLLKLVYGRIGVLYQSVQTGLSEGARRRCSADPVKQRIEQEADRYEQRPAEHAAAERHVQQHDEAEDDQIVHVHQRGEPERRPRARCRRPPAPAFRRSAAS